MASGVSTVCDRLRRHPIKYAAAMIAIVALAALTATSCSFVGGPVSGRVLNVETGMPIPGAVVVVRWDADPIGPYSHAICFRVETAVSNEEGRYRVPMWWQVPPAALTGNAKVSDAYYPGFEAVHSHTKEAEAHPEDVYMKKFAGSGAARLEFIGRRVFSGMDCLGAGMSRRNLFILHSAAVREAKGLAQSPGDIAQIEGMRRVAAIAWLAGPRDGPVELSPFSKLPPDVRRALE